MQRLQAPLKLLVFTWNAGHALPDEAEHAEWLPNLGGDLDLLLKPPR